MNTRFQFGWLAAGLIAVVMAAGPVAGVVSAQTAQNHPNSAPHTQQAPAHHAPSAKPNGNAQNANRPPARSAERPANRAPETRVDRPAVRQPDNSTERSNNRNENRPPNATMRPERSNNFNNRPTENSPGARFSPRQQAGVGAARPFVDRMRDLTPSQRDRVLQNSGAFQNLAPEQQSRIRQQFNQWDHLNAQQRADLRSKEDTWRRMTPDQRDYVKNQVLPKWKQMPWERQQVIQQKLGVLQNMPESARNRRLSDPNFTRGMSDEDRQTLHDLSHLHVGGAPDPPGNEQ